MQELLRDQLCFLQQVGRLLLLWLNFGLQLLDLEPQCVAVVTEQCLNQFLLTCSH